jgi:nucleoid DNA-binding protein
VKIPPIIRELLLHHEKVVIPGFGALVIEHRPAFMDKSTNNLIPPSKTIRFNAAGKEDDGTLSAYLVRRLRIEAPEAEAAVAQFAAGLKALLEEDKKAEIEGIGHFTRNSSGDLAFEALPELQQLLGSFGLPVLEIPAPKPAAASASNIPPRIAEPARPGPAPTITLPLPELTRRRRRRWPAVAAVLAAITGLAAVVYYTGFYHDVTRAVASLMETVQAPAADSSRIVFGSRNKRQERDSMQQAVGSEIDRKTAREQALMYTEPEQAAPTGTAVAETPAPVAPQGSQPAVASTGGHYHIIAGAFLVPNNAERQKQVLEEKGLAPVLLPPTGNYYMVSLGNYASKEQAIAAMRKMKEEVGGEMWVMKK